VGPAAGPKETNMGKKKWKRRASAAEIMFDDPKTVPDLRPQMRRLRNEAKRGLRIIEQESKPEAGK
ncbi:MAG TPA: hypothetical protein PKW90_19250, partial [Myxococcota bacterium]|nr:hypothetical protein [Myxococcota bacterium]